MHVSIYNRWLLMMIYMFRNTLADNIVNNNDLSQMLRDIGAAVFSCFLGSNNMTYW
jgi:hypothetical protein